jgi:hypothetical protein
MKALYFIVGGIVLCVWAIVGFLLWIPLIARVIAVFVTSVTTSLYTQHDTANARSALDTATRFYVKGFTTIIEQLGILVHGNPDAAEPSEPHLEKDAQTNWVYVGKELLWAFVFGPAPV